MNTVMSLAELNAAAAATGDPCFRKFAAHCPVHDVRGHHERAALAFGRSKSIDGGYVRLGEGSSTIKRSALQREAAAAAAAAAAADGFLRGRNPFRHSHSVTCATDGSKASAAAEQNKAKSVGSLSGQQRPPRPNVLELCPNHNTSFNAYRRRYSRSSNRSLDFDEYCAAGDLASTFTPARSRRRSSSKDSGRSYNAVFSRHEDAGGHGRWNNIRKGLSLLSLCAGSEEFEDEDRYYRSNRILRPPTRHFHTRGISGLPVKCPAKYMGLAY